MKRTIDDQEIADMISSGKTMNVCSKELGISFMTFKRKAISLGLYSPNTGRKGLERNPAEFDKIRIPLDNIISGEFKKYYSSSRLRKRLIKDGYKKNKCEECGLEEWNGKNLTCELHHIDGNRCNNKLENLLIVCPNCHSQTPNHSKKK